MTKEHEYVEGREATDNFERGMAAVFKVSKDEVVKAEKAKKKRSSRVASLRKPKISDKD